MRKFIKNFKCFLLSFVILICSSSVIPLNVYAATDVTGHWAESKINEWISKGYISGYPDNTFRPNNPISRAEIVVLINKAFKVSGSASINFDDVNSGFWAYSEISKGVGYGYIKGNGNGKFLPSNMVTRQEAAVMLCKIKGLSEDEAYSNGYNDSYTISNWAKGSIGAVSKYKIMQGFPNGNFNPQGNMTRAEAVIALDNALNSSIEQNNNSYVPENNKNNNTNSNNTATVSNGNYKLSKEDKQLKNKTIKGDLIIPEDITATKITLTNVDVEGTLYNYGAKYIEADDCEINKIILDKNNSEFISNSGNTINKTEFSDNGKISGKGYKDVTIDKNKLSSVIIDAEADYVFLDAETSIKIYSNSDIETFEATKNSASSTISFSSGSKVNKMDIKGKISITGKSSIKTLTAYVDGIRSEIRPTTTYTRNGASTPNYVTTSSSSGKHNSSSSKYDSLSFNSKNEHFDGNSKNYNNVSINAEGVKLSNITIYGDLTIGKDVANGEATLQNVEVRGKTYIYGGGENSIIFKNCDLRGDIVSDTSKKNVSNARKNDPVALKFSRDTDISGKIRILGNTIIESDSSNRITVSKVQIEEELQGELYIDVNIDELKIDKKARVKIAGSRNIETVNIGSDANNTEIILESGSAYINTLNSYAKTDVSGNGSVYKINAYDYIYLSDNIFCNDLEKHNDVKITSITINPDNVKLNENESTQLNIVYNPQNVSNKNVTWVSNNENIVKVNQSGFINAVGEGKATITAISEEGNKTAVCNVEVIKVTIDTSPIDSAVSNANNAMKDIVVDSSSDNVEPGVFWTDSDSFNALKNSIEAAVKAKDNVKSKNDVDSVVNSLNDAVDKFNVSLKQGTKVIDLSPIDSAVSNANNAMKGIVVDSSSDNVEPGIFWTDSESFNSLKSAISSAVKAKDTVKSKDDVDSVVNSLNDAVDKFNVSLKQGTKVVDLSPIDSAVSNANNAMKGIVVDSSSDNVEPGTFWTDSDSFNALKSAISSAVKAKDTVKSKDDVNFVINSLNDAVDKFNASLKQGTKVIDLSPIDNAVSDANNAMNGIVVDSSSDNVEPGTFWTDSDSFNALKSAISSAVKAKDTVKSKDEINSVVNALNNAVLKFNATLKQGTKKVLDLSPINNSISKAITAKSGVTVSPDGNNIKSNKKWTTQANMNYLDNEISTANDAINSVANQNEVTAVVQRLENAISTFKNSIQYGKIPYQKDELNALINTAKTTISLTITSVNGTDVNKDKYWATAESKKKLQDAINAAIQVNNNQNASELMVENAINNLSSAFQEFNRNKKPGTI